MTNMNAGLWALSTLPKYPSRIMVWCCMVILMNKHTYTWIWATYKVRLGTGYSLQSLQNAGIPSYQSHRKHMQPANLLHLDDQLTAHDQPIPFKDRNLQLGSPYKVWTNEQNSRVQSHLRTYNFLQRISIENLSLRRNRGTPSCVVWVSIFSPFCISWHPLVTNCFTSANRLLLCFWC